MPSTSLPSAGDRGDYSQWTGLDNGNSDDIEASWEVYSGA